MNDTVSDVKPAPRAATMVRGCIRIQANGSIPYAVTGWIMEIKGDIQPDYQGIAHDVWSEDSLSSSDLHRVQFEAPFSSCLRGDAAILSSYPTSNITWISILITNESFVDRLSHRCNRARTMQHETLCQIHDRMGIFRIHQLGWKFRYDTRTRRR
jgi:hypothetical protein